MPVDSIMQTRQHFDINVQEVDSKLSCTFWLLSQERKGPGRESGGGQSWKSFFSFLPWCMEDSRLTRRKGANVVLWTWTSVTTGALRLQSGVCCGIIALLGPRSFVYILGGLRTLWLERLTYRKLRGKEFTLIRLLFSKRKMSLQSFSIICVY